MSPTGLVHIGTAGWHYDHWRGSFYPVELPKKEFLAYYTRVFHTVEVNNSFYRLPGESALTLWRDTAPENFIFAVKGSRYITHMKKLKDVETSVAAFVERMELLGSAMGPILFQLPPRWRCNIDRLNYFVDILPQKERYSFEFREPSWYNDDVLHLLRDHQMAFCIHELAGHTSPREVTAEFVYVRLHGPEGAYQGEYGRKGLSTWAESISTWVMQGREVFCYFDNDEAGYAVRDAMTLEAMITRG